MTTRGKVKSVEEIEEELERKGYSEVCEDHYLNTLNHYLATTERNPSETDEDIIEVIGEGDYVMVDLEANEDTAYSSIEEATDWLRA